MENNENFVAEQVTENVEQTTEQTPKLFTQDEVNEIVGKSKARERAKVTKQFERKYGQLENVLKTGTGQDSVEEIADTFQKHYEKRGIQFAPKPSYTEKDIEILAQADANEIIGYGYDEVVEEVAEEEVEVVKPVNNSGTPIEIIRNDIDDTNTEQLNLF